jgi:hypothetical protein
MNPSYKQRGIDPEELFNWLEQQPELAHLRHQAASVMCEYRPAERNQADRINLLNRNTELAGNDPGPLRKLIQAIWVPGRGMRGKAYSTPEMDASLNSVAKLMSISTIWDFVCTIPLFNFGLSTFLGAAAFPGAVVLSLALLLASNVAGETATNRQPRHAARATWSLTAFILLCAAKTLFSGVGVDLAIGSRAIASNYAEELAQEKLEKDKEELNRLEAGGAEFRRADSQCKELREQLKVLGANRSANDTQYVSLYVQAYGSNADNLADRGLTAEQLSNRYGSPSNIPGACRQAKALQEINSTKAKPLTAAIERKSQAIASKPALAYLEQEEPEIYAEHFRNGPGGSIEWVNGTEAVGQATNQFYANLLKGEFGLLGFSLFMMAVSVILTGAASLMIYLTSQNPEVQASYTDALKKFRDERLNDYQRAIEETN